MFDVKTLSYNIKKYRKTLNLSQNELASALLVSCQAVSKWERGQSVPDLENLCAMSKIFRVSIDNLLGVNSFDKKVMLGVDGGGTKTEFVLFDKDGNVYARTVEGASNPNAVGIDGSFATLKLGIDKMLGVTPAIDGIFIGCAGFSLGENVSEIKEKLAYTYPQIKIKCSTDIYNVIASACDDDNCIAVICGTGSSVFACNDGNLTRVTGWGYLLGKSGSGYDLGRDAIYACLQEMDGLGKKTELTTLVSKRAGNNVSQIISSVYKSDQTYVASFAKDVIIACKNGDEVALEILDNNAKRLAEVINFTHEKHGKSNKIIASGSIFTTNDVFLDAMKKHLKSGLEIIIPTTSQVLGACKLCAKNLGINVDIDTLQYSYDEIIKGEKNNA